MAEKEILSKNRPGLIKTPNHNYLKQSCGKNRIMKISGKKPAHSIFI